LSGHPLLALQNSEKNIFSAVTQKYRSLEGITTHVDLARSVSNYPYRTYR